MSESGTGTSKKEKQQYKKRKIITCHISPSSSLSASHSGLTTILGENAVSPGEKLWLVGVLPPFRERVDGEHGVIVSAVSRDFVSEP